MTDWIVKYAYTDGTVETHRVAARSAADAIDTAQPDHVGTKDVRKIQVVAA